MKNMWLETVTKISKHLYTSNSPVKTWRSNRMQKFLSLMKLPNCTRIIDLGGTPYMWELIAHNFDVTLVNLPGSIKISDRIKGYTFVEGDATNLLEQFDDKSFDIVFSNSVIEHVGDEKKQAFFASEVRRLANSYWIQTPSNRCPIELHTGVPFYWQFPQFVRDKLIENWSNKWPGYGDFVKQLRVLSRSRMAELFPDSEVFIERKFGFEKSYSFYKPLKISS